MTTQPRRRWFLIAMKSSRRNLLIFSSICILTVSADGQTGVAFARQCHARCGRYRRANCNNKIASVPRRPESASETRHVVPESGNQDLPIAVVLGKPVLHSDVHIDTGDRTALRDYTAIAPHIFGPLIAKYVADRHIIATADEIDGYKERHPANDEIASAAIIRWKANRSLLDEYGGPVVWQQLGWEPVGAYVKWLKVEGKVGNFKILEPKWEAAFWNGLDRNLIHPLPNDAKMVELLKTPPWSVPHK